MHIEVDNTQLLKALEQLPPEDLKEIINRLFKKGLFKKPKFDEVSEKVRQVVSKEGITQDVVEEAIKWAREQK